MFPLRHSSLAASLLIAIALLAVSCMRYPNRTADNGGGDDNADDPETISAQGDHDLTISETWTGQYNLPGFGGAPSPLIIRDAAAFESFVGQIPKKVVQPTSPQPDTTDPMVVDTPDIDFDKHMLIVIVRGENMYTKAEVRGVRVEAGKVVVDAWYPDATEESQWQNQQGTGTYCAVLVETAAGYLLQVNITWEGGLPLATAKVYRGRYHMGGPDGGNQTPDPLIIRDIEAYHAFVAGIPEREIVPTQTRPASNDPLLKKPDFDFARQMLIVIFRGENMYSTLDVLDLRSDGTTIKASARYEDPAEGNMQASQDGIGTYTALLVDRADGDELVIEKVGH